MTHSNFKGDSIDAKIIELLVKNARLDNKEIAKEAGISDRTVARRIRNMEDIGIIKGYTVKIGSGLYRDVVSEGLAEKGSASISEWESLRTSLAKIFGQGSMTILFCIGYDMGRDIGEKMRDSGLENSGQCLAFAQTLQDRGWGKVDIDSIDVREAKGKISIVNSLAKKSTAEASCYEVKGIIAGFFESIFHRKFRVTEDKCVRRGDDRCEFVFEGEEKEHGY